MSDITSTSFGLIIAYFLPGMVGMYTLTFYSKYARTVFSTFLTSESNIGLFLLVCLFALTLGLILTVLRWLVYEKCLCKTKSCSISFKDFKSIGQDEKKLNAFRATVDEHYRYHQFFGSISIVSIPFMYGLITYNNLSKSALAFTVVFLLFFQIALIMAAIDAFNKYVDRSKSIMEVDQND